LRVAGYGLRVLNYWLISRKQGSNLKRTTYYVQPPWGRYKKKGTRMEIQPRFKIQYPMKNRGKTNVDF